MEVEFRQTPSIAAFQRLGEVQYETLRRTLAGAGQMQVTRRLGVRFQKNLAMADLS